MKSDVKEERRGREADAFRDFRATESVRTDFRSSASYYLAVGPFRLVVDPDSVGDARDVVEVRDDLDRIADRCVVESLRPKGVDVRRIHLGCDVRQLHGEVAESTLAWREVGLPIVVRCVLREICFCALGTEVVGMSPRSVVAALLGGRDRRKQLTLLA